MSASGRPFRFGVVATPHGGGAAWEATARRVAQLGYDTLLMPDGMQLLAPVPSLAYAAGAAGVRVGTFVLAAPLRPARSTAWEAHSLSVLTGGRFELGLGTGLPSARAAAVTLGLPYGSPAERLERVARTIEHLRELDGPEHRTPVLIAAGGPKALALAAQHADTVTFAAGPLTPRAEIAGRAARLRELAGPRAGQIELAMNLFVVGDDVPAHAERYIGADAAALVEADSLVLLRGSTRDMVDELQRRRDAIGASYVTVNGEYVEQLAPVVEFLAGR